MIKKGLIFGFIAVLSAGLLFVGCSQATNSEPSPNEGRGYDVEVTVETELRAALESPVLSIGVTGVGFPLTADLEIPVGKTVYVFAPLTIADDMTLEVKGTVVLDSSGTLTVVSENDQLIKVTDGTIEVYRGALIVDAVEAVEDSTGDPALYADKIKFTGGILELTVVVEKLAGVEKIFAKVSQGELQIAGLAEAVKPSVLAKTFTTSATRRLTIAGTVPEDVLGDTATEIIIPVGLSFGTADSFANVTDLTVNGGLGANGATFASLTTLTVGAEGGLTTADSANYGKLTALTVNGIFSTASLLASLETLTVGTVGGFSTTADVGSAAADSKGVTLVINGAATFAAINKLKTSTINGKLIAEEFTPFDATAVLTAAAGSTINGIKFTAEAKVTGLAEDTAVIGDITVLEGLGLTIPADATLAIAAGSTLTNNGVVTIEPTGTLQLNTASASSVAKIAGTGRIIAGATIISGAWEVDGGAVDGSLAILSGEDGVGATITAITATGLKASATGGLIIQGAVASNALTIDEDTVITLGGTGTAKVGEIRLTADDTNPANLVFAGTSSNIKIGAGTGGTEIDGVNNPTIGNKVIVIDDLLKADFENDSNDKLVLLGGTTAGSITAGGIDNGNVWINSEVGAYGET